jgi:hypothetical protein
MFFFSLFYVFLFYIPPSKALTAALESQLCSSKALLAESRSNPISHTEEMASSLLVSLAYVSVQNLAVVSNLARSLKRNETKQKKIYKYTYDSLLEKIL